MPGHVDLFSGLGGFALAARANGLHTVCFVEKDRRCRDFLSKAWPGVPVYDDVKTFDGREWSNAFLLTGGVPCQPASRAGKQRGAADDRWLWPEALRVLGEVRPAWALFENCPGIGDVGLNGLLAALAEAGYELPRTEEGWPIVFNIPACAAGFGHERQRIWIVAHSAGKGHKGRNTTMLQRQVERFIDEHDQVVARFACPDGLRRRLPDCDGSLVDGLHRSLLGALGNSIVWPLAAKIIAAMLEAEKSSIIHNP